MPTHSLATVVAPALAPSQDPTLRAVSTNPPHASVHSQLVDLRGNAGGHISELLLPRLAQPSLGFELTGRAPAVRCG